MANPSSHGAAGPQGVRKMRAENRADVLRVLLALALLAFLSWFDGGGQRPATPETQLARLAVTGATAQSP